MTEATSLIERLEALESPCRECDLELWWEVKANRGSPKKPMPKDYREANLRMDDAPLYTSSLDAAMSLVPEGYGWRLWVPSSTSLSPMVVTMWGNGQKYAPNESTAATPAIALCIASLKAQESSNGR